MASSFFADLEDGPDEPWFIEPKDRDPAPEEDRQRGFLHDARILAPSLIIWAVPNAARRTQWEIGKAKREGLVTGTLDLTILWKGGSAYPEFKDGQKMPTPGQREMLNRMFRAGHHCGVFRTSVCLLAWLQERGAPVRAHGFPFTSQAQS